MYESGFVYHGLQTHIRKHNLAGVQLDTLIGNSLLLYLVQIILPAYGSDTTPATIISNTTPAGVVASDWSAFLTDPGVEMFLRKHVIPFVSDTTNARSYPHYGLLEYFIEHPTLIIQTATVVEHIDQGLSYINDVKTQYKTVAYNNDVQNMLLYALPMVLASTSQRSSLAYRSVDDVNICDYYYTMYRQGTPIYDGVALPPEIIFEECKKLLFFVVYDDASKFYTSHVF